jgi:putative restriction endonuclease
MKFWVGVTDNKWFQYLSQSGADEVNFWQPSGTAPFVGLEPGSLFLFKLKRPYNHIAGGGTFVKFSSLPMSMVWDAFGDKNGASTRAEFERMIRGLAPNPGLRDPNVGCTVLAAPFFWPRELWIEEPPAWSGNIVRGKYYETSRPEGAQIWEAVQARMQSAYLLAPREQVREPQARYGTPGLVMPRLGQGAFRVVVTEAYSRRCAITGESTLPVLEAAHILPFAEEGPNEISNGMLLRSDFHKLFDSGFVTVTPDMRVEVSSRIREEWFNGKAYYRLHGEQLKNVPSSPGHKPNAEFLRWHNENRFQG